MGDEQEKTTQPGTALTKVNDHYLPMIERQLTGNGIQMDGYAKQCVIAALSAIHTVLDKNGVMWNDTALDKSNVTQTLLTVACLKLNAAANPREVYFITRNTKAKDADGKDYWKKQIEMGIEGDGNDSILARFGRDVKKVGQYWLVREGDKFEYPSYTGLELEPPKWTPSGKGPVVRVVYPIIKQDDSIEFYIGERDDVIRNLLAHINNNLKNETFGVCKDWYNANSQQRKEIVARRAEVMKRANELGFAVLDDPDLQEWISPAWTEYHSREGMFWRKMRNNVVKKIPKNFGSAFIEMTYSEQVDEAPMRAEIAANANGETIDVEPPPVAEAAVASDPPPVETTSSQAAHSAQPKPEAPVKVAPAGKTIQATLDGQSEPNYED